MGNQSGNQSGNRGLRCPGCGNGEMHPHRRALIIRGYKVIDAKGVAWSQCLRCSGYYDKYLKEYPHNHRPHLGWFNEFGQRDIRGNLHG